MEGSEYTDFYDALAASPSHTPKNGLVHTRMRPSTTDIRSLFLTARGGAGDAMLVQVMAAGKEGDKCWAHTDLLRPITLLFLSGCEINITIPLLSA